MRTYLDLLREILDNGLQKNDRTGVGTKSLFGRQIRFDLSTEFPLITTKKIHTHSLVHELLWFLSGSSNIQYLKDNNVTIWNHWADEHGELGPVYGVQWRKWVAADGQEHDQIAQLIDGIMHNPDSRRHIISAWNVGEIENMKLPPCHSFMQFYVIDGNLSCHLYMRSADIFLGVPFNIASYSLLCAMIAQVTGLKAHELIISFGDIHLYNNHFEQASLQLSREPLALPTLRLDPLVTNIDDFRAEHISFVGYQCYDPIKAQIAV